MTEKDIIDSFKIDGKLPTIDAELAAALVKYLRKDGNGTAEIMHRVSDLTTALRFLEFSLATDAVATYLDERLRVYLGRLTRTAATPDEEESAN